MFERYTEPARRALFFSRYEATQQGRWAIEPEHLLLGVVREPTYVVAGVLTAAQVSSDLLQKEITRESESRESVPLSAEIPFSAPTKRALAFAAEEADRLLHSDIGTEHLLLGLLREEDPVASAVLRRHGLDVNWTRSEIVRLRASPRAATDTGSSSFATGFGVEPVAVEALHAIRERLQAAENAFDPDPIVEVMADDVVLMVPNEPVQEGKADAAAFVRRTLDEQQEWFDRVISYVSDEVSIRGPVAFDRGSFSFTVVVKHDGRRNEATGKYLWLYTWDRGGGWKIARAILSLDDPPEGQ